MPIDYFYNLAVTSGQSQENRGVGQGWGCKGRTEQVIDHFNILAVEASFYGDTGRMMAFSWLSNIHCSSHWKSDWNA